MSLPSYVQGERQTSLLSLGVDAAVANAGSIVSVGAVAIGGRGGGKANMGQGRGAEGSDAALAITAMAAALGVPATGAAE